MAEVVIETRSDVYRYSMVLLLTPNQDLRAVWWYWQNGVWRQGPWRHG